MIEHKKNISDTIKKLISKPGLNPGELPKESNWKRELNPVLTKEIAEQIKRNRWQSHRYQNQTPFLKRTSRVAENSIPTTQTQAETTRQRQESIQKRVDSNGEMIAPPRLAKKRTSEWEKAKTETPKTPSSMAKLYVPLGSVIGGVTAAGVMNWLLS
ncbi:hypothetical protein IPJ72_02845 [Candidatus Peregrinibacteria bacterium]|nr:MAG: hypothetical protein IPJ72_02845 [Candidatus Peregrinibacteria bacterium]